MFEKFTDRAREVVVLAQEEARMFNHDYVGTEHILLGLIHAGEGVATKTLESLGISLEAVRQQVEEIIGQGQQAPSGHIPFTPRAKKVFELSLREALHFGHDYIGTEHILLGLIREGEGVAAQVLVKLGADLNRVRQQIIQLLSGYAEPQKGSAPSQAAPATFGLLDQVGRNLTNEARAGRLDPVIGRQTQIAQIMQVLMLRTRNSVMLVGEPGVGKTALGEGLAQKIANAEVPLALKDTQVYSVDLGAIVARSRLWPDFEKRLDEFRRELHRHGNIVLFIDDAGGLISAGSAGVAVDAASILKPMLVRGELRLIATAAPSDYRRHLAADAALAQRFQPINVAQLTISETMEILKVLRDRYQKHHRVAISDVVLVAITEFAQRSLPGRRMPGRAIDLLDLAGAQARMRAPVVSEELLELEQQFVRVRAEKESAIDAQDFEKATLLRQTERSLMAAKRSIGDGSMDAVIDVEESDVAAAVAIMSGTSLTGGPAQHQDKPRNRPSGQQAFTTGHDAEIWAIS
jgi:ATP-dependent Clp protease ATP-binding subunit ClpC